MSDLSNRASMPAGVEGQATSYNMDKTGSADRLQFTLKDASGEGSMTGIYNIDTPEGQQAAIKALTQHFPAESLPEFVQSAANQDFINSLPKEMRDQLLVVARDISANVNTELKSTSSSQVVNQSSVQSTEQASTASSSSQSASTSQSQMQGRWAAYLQGASDFMGNLQDVNALIQFVLRLVYLENTKDLRFFAEKVKFFNALKKKIREEAMNAREYLSKQVGLKPSDDLKGTYNNSASGTGPLKFATEPKIDENGGLSPYDPTSRTDPPMKTKEDLENYIRNLEEQLNAVGDDAQLANVDLQNMLQKQQQTLQLLSNISKMLHDTAMAIIRKIGT